MKHEMKLNVEPFNKIKSGKKTIELRLNDEKRQLVKIKDLIEFTNRETEKKY
jgi:ASC-1-like (ASCH) protein